ncbi:hypothetical protein H8K32_12245 [Undibacterium jejuense]|uniref:Uncharacterized protein n=1 Tax=Undibacterium jejuense TaxID=1344949 RepID=A0A923HJJ0_9BURK|nr:hypothetical protein [Undibacterium jejuense]MBC3862877.1 hypothetical protein [Undibacterium jejuense]
MNEFKLAAGSVVKLGAITTQLYPILRNGLAANTPAHQFDATGANDAGRSNTPGVQIGELMAYFSACAGFCSNTSAVHHQHEEVMGRFVTTLQDKRGEKPVMPELEEIAHQAGLPVVLEMILEEDCVLLADTQFVSESEIDKSWKFWRSGFLQREGGIPSTWIKQFYFPRLLDYRDVTAAKNPRSLEQTTDAALMVGGLMQKWHKDAPGDLLAAFRKQYGRINFSQRSNFDETSLERFFNLNAMIDPATRLLNQMTMWQDIDALAKKQGISLN